MTNLKNNMHTKNQQTKIKAFNTGTNVSNILITKITYSISKPFQQERFKTKSWKHSNR